MKKILVVEDEIAIREFVIINLQRAGYETVQADDGVEALKIYEEHKGDFDIALVDLMMPNMDGLELSKRLRKDSTNLGIIILTAKSQEMDKVTSLLIGADDYVTKPFSPTELVARIDALYRRVEMNKKLQDESLKTGKLTSGEFTLNLRSRALFKNDKEIELTQVEFQIMEYFFQNIDAALSRVDILARVWGEAYFGEEKIVDVNMRRLRMKIEDDPSQPRHVLTIWGYGYKWAQ